MKKIKKKNNNKALTIQANKPEVKCSRVTISSRVCNQKKFNELFELLDNTTIYKNTISLHCFNNLTSIVIDYNSFVTQYKDFQNSQLNSWEIQNIFQEISLHYSETAKRYLSKAKFIVTKPKSNISNTAILINSNSNLKLDNGKYLLNFNVKDKLKQINEKLDQYNADLILEKDKDLITKLEKNIAICHQLITQYKGIETFSLNKPEIFSRLINLITTKKLRLLSLVKLRIYKTGTHARNLNNTKYQYFLKIRKLSTLIGREPKNKDKENLTNNLSNNPYKQKLLEFNDKNFIYLPLIFNSKKLNSIVE